MLEFIEYSGRLRFTEFLIDSNLLDLPEVAEKVLTVDKLFQPRLEIPRLALEP